MLWGVWVMHKGVGVITIWSHFIINFIIILLIIIIIINFIIIK